jgi:hypothetical protein
MRVPNQCHGDHIQLATIRGDQRCDCKKVMKLNIQEPSEAHQGETGKKLASVADLYKHGQYL